MVSEDVQLVDILFRFAGHDGVGAAGIVADHPAERVVRVGGGIGAKGEAVLVGGVTEPVEDCAGLDPSVLVVRVERDDAIQIFCAVEHDGDVAALAGEAGSTSPSENWRAVAAADGYRVHDIFGGFWNHDADRNLPVVGAIGGVEGAGTSVEADFAFDIVF